MAAATTRSIAENTAVRDKNIGTAVAATDADGRYTHL